jgi:hypothetical protein
MIWLLPQPFPSLPTVNSNGYSGATQEDYNIDKQPADGRGGGGGEEPNRTTARKPRLYKSFNTLWYTPMDSS